MHSKVRKKSFFNFHMQHFLLIDRYVNNWSLFSGYIVHVVVFLAHFTYI